MKNDIKLLDCTLRDGGYVNDWKWGHSCAKEIISCLVKANVDVIEIGFLRNVEKYDPDVTVCNTIEELNQLVPDAAGGAMFSAMAMRSNYDISKLSPYSGKGVEMIRITAHEYDIKEGLEFAEQVKALGYKLSINPINIMGYTDEQVLWILDRVNHILPYQFSVVDTFGSMRRRDLDRIISLVDHNLDRNIRVALHLHENMSMGCCLAQNFLDKHLNRPISVDASLMGMGRIPGNLPIELISDYLNEYADKNYDIDFMMDAIQDYIAPIKGEQKWGYSPAYFLSARFNLHRNYAEYFLNKGDLTNRDIDHILSHFDRSRAAVFSAEYADKLYSDYKNNIIDDTADKEKLQKELVGRNILLLAPGASIVTHLSQIQAYIKTTRPIIISVNFIPEQIPCDYAFFSNNKRFARARSQNTRLIMTSNIAGGKSDYMLNYNGLTGTFSQGCNSFLMCLKLMSEIGIREVAVAGADGYDPEGQNYCDTSFRSATPHNNAFNVAVANAIEKISVRTRFLTPSKYDI